MKRSRPDGFYRTAVVGLDGSGKSTAAHGSAQLLSEAHKDRKIIIADSDGVSEYRNGEIVRRRLGVIEKLIPPANVSKLGRVGLSLSFMLARQYSEQLFAHGPDRLVVGVREPFRVEPAAYAPILLSERFSNMSPERRLKLFGYMTRAAHADLIATIDVDAQAAVEKAEGRGEIDYHETPERVAMVAGQLPLVIDAYSRMYGAGLAEVTGLRPDTSDRLAEVLEPFVPRS